MRHSERTLPSWEDEIPARCTFATRRITQIQQALGDILQWSGPADATLKRWFRAHPALGSRDRVEVADAIYDILRHLRRYQHDAALDSGATLRRLAILGLLAIQGHAALAHALSIQETQWLTRRAALDLQDLPYAVRESLPDWLAQRLAGLVEANTLIAALNQPAPLDLRVNLLKTDRDTVMRCLQAGEMARYKPCITPYSPWGIRLSGHPAIRHWPQFEAGEIEVQDESSQLLGLLVAPRRGEMVIDFCAGAGGKTLLLGALMRSTGRLYAFDISAARLARAKARFTRSGLSNVVPRVIHEEQDAYLQSLAGKAQRVLVDAPCSGLGTLRRHPDLKWRQHPDTLQALCQRQTRILAAAARCVRPAGRLVYATCSVLPEENEDQAERFLMTHPQFERLDAAALLHSRCASLALEGPYMQLRPDRQGTDGFFAAVFERRR